MEKGNRKKFWILTAIVLVFAALYGRYGSNFWKKTSEDVTKAVENNKATEKTVESAPVIPAFDIGSLPTAKIALGNFPYIPKLDGFVNKVKDLGDLKSFDVFTGGNNFLPVQGNVAMQSFSVPEGQKWDESNFIKGFTDFFDKLGAKKIWEGKIPDEAKEALNKAKNQPDYADKFTSASLEENQVVYGIKEGEKTTFFTVASDSDSGTLAVVESTASTSMAPQTKEAPKDAKSEEIIKDLNEKGKAVLKINFDTGRTTLNAEGTESVNEIAKVLKADSNLKIAINGYTDNVGSEQQNLKISKERSDAVLNALVALGIDKSRLTSEGFGSKDPIADNGTQEGRLQNRRVELVKK